MMTHDTVVKSYSEFQSVISGHIGKLFRGQITDYIKIIPSHYRNARNAHLQEIESYSERLKSLYFKAYKVNEAASIAAAQDKSSNDNLIALNDSIENDELSWIDRFIQRLLKINLRNSDDENWNPLSPSIGHGFGLPSQYNECTSVQWLYPVIAEYGYGLLQHYGISTPVLDVSYDPFVALWFATHKFKQEKNSDIAWYERTEIPGVVYVMKTQNRVIDLREGEVIPIAGLRGKRQEGGLLTGATQASPDLSPNVVMSIQIYPETFESTQENLIKLTTPYLFPCPVEDVFYGELLNAKKSDIEEIRHVAQAILKYRHCCNSPVT